MCSPVLPCALMYTAERQLSFPAGTNEVCCYCYRYLGQQFAAEEHPFSSILAAGATTTTTKTNFQSFFTPVPFVATQLAQSLSIKSNDGMNKVNCYCCCHYCYCWKAPGLESESSIQRNIVGLIWVQHFQCHQ